MQYLTLRSGSSGPRFVGVNDGDTLLWSAAQGAFYVGPGGGGGGAVSSVFGRTGAVTAHSSDYDSDQISNLSVVPGAFVSDALDYLLANAGAVSSVFGRTGAVTAQAGDYNGAKVTNDSSVTGSTVKDALNWLLANAGAVASVFGRVGVVTAQAGDYNATKVTNDSSVTGTSVKDALNNLAASIIGLVASQIGNDSTVTGATVKDALNTLKTTLTGYLKADGSVPLAGTWSLGNQQVTNAKTISYQQVVNLGDVGTVTQNIDANAGQYQKLRMIGSPTLTVTAPPGPMAIELTLTQDATGGRTPTFWTISGDAPPIDTTPNAVNVVSIEYDGAAWSWNYKFVRNPDVSSNAADRIDGNKITPNFGSQNIVSTGYLGIGGALLPSAGAIRLPSLFQIFGRTTTGANALLAQLPAGDSWVLGDSTIPMIINGAGAMSFRSGNTVCATLDTAALVMYSPGVTFLSSTTSPVVSQATQTVSGTSQKLVVRAQNNTVAATTGGAFDCGPGSGVTAGGLGRCMSGSNAQRFGWNDTGFCLGAGTPSAQPARVGQLTDATGGTPGSTISDVGGAFSQTTLNNNFASIVQRLNALESAAHSQGVTA